MSENIAGYVDRSYVKGQYYRYAAAPKPVIFNGNINNVSSEMLVKAMYVTKGSAEGDFPNDTGLTFLITTVEYGNSTYLQTAFSVSTGYEYTRIYSGTWSSWLATDSDVAGLKDTVSGYNAQFDQVDKDISAVASDLSELTGPNGAVTSAINASNSANALATSANNTANGINTRISALGSKIAVMQYELGDVYVSGNSTYTFDVDISRYGFNSIIAVFPSTLNTELSAYNIIPFIQTVRSNVLFKCTLYRIGTTRVSVRGRVITFLILGT